MEQQTTSQSAVVLSLGDQAKAAGLLGPQRQALCQVCLKRQFKYTCPRCETVYCSSDCYKGHSGSCTEAFFQAQVVDRLLNQKPNEDETRAMQRKLRAFYESWERDEDVIRELSQGDLQDINNFFTSSKHSTENAESEDDDAFLDDSRIEELVKLAEQDKLEEQHLTAKELKLFHSALKRGKLDKEVESWSPWWHQAVCVLDDCAAQPSHICCSKTTQPNFFCVGLFITQLFYGYCWMCRRYNGSIPKNQLLDALSEFFCIVPGFTAEKCIPPNTVEETVESVLSRVQPLLQCDDQRYVPLLCYSDVLLILKEKWKALRLLKELRTLILQMYRHPVVSEHRQQRKRLLKKLDYYNSFVEYHLYTSPSTVVTPLGKGDMDISIARENPAHLEVSENKRTDRPMMNKPSDARSSAAMRSCAVSYCDQPTSLALFLFDRVQNIVNYRWNTLDDIEPAVMIERTLRNSNHL